MQLLYIWIEDYKNIKRQGFNFSPTKTKMLSSFFNKFLSLFLKKTKMDRNYILEKLQKNAPFFAQFLIIRIGLFGSYAQECAREESDIDLVFVMTEGESLSFKSRIAIEQFLISLFPYKRIDFVNFKYLNPLVKIELEKDVIYVSTKKDILHSHYA